MYKAIWLRRAALEFCKPKAKIMFKEVTLFTATSVTLRKMALTLGYEYLSQNVDATDKEFRNDLASVIHSALISFNLDTNHGGYPAWLTLAAGVLGVNTKECDEKGFDTHVTMDALVTRCIRKLRESGDIIL